MTLAIAVPGADPKHQHDPPGAPGSVIPGHPRPGSVAGKQIALRQPRGGVTASGMPAALLRQTLLLWGRVRRFCLNVMRPGSVRERVARRHGACQRCGACCQLGSRCRHLRFENGLAVCACYDGQRPLNCRTFPIDARDLTDRDLVLPERSCGFYWSLPDGEVRAPPSGGETVPAAAMEALAPVTVAARATGLTVPAPVPHGDHGAGANQSAGASAR